MKLTAHHPLSAAISDYPTYSLLQHLVFQLPVQDGGVQDSRCLRFSNPDLGSRVLGLSSCPGHGHCSGERLGAAGFPALGWSWKRNVAVIPPASNRGRGEPVISLLGRVMAASKGVKLARFTSCTEAEGIILRRESRLHLPSGPVEVGVMVDEVPDSLCLDLVGLEAGREYGWMTLGENLCLVCYFP